MHRNKHRRASESLLNARFDRAAPLLEQATLTSTREKAIEAVAKDMGLDLGGVLLRRFGQKIWDEAIQCAEERDYER